MYIESIAYSRKHQNNSWKIFGKSEKESSVHLNPINLVVGKNATGKSNFVNIIDMLADVLCGEHTPNDFVYDTASYDVTFNDNGDKLNYILSYKEGIIITEKLMRNGTSLFERTASKGKIRYEALDEMLDFETDPKAIVVSRRDNIQHPFLNPLYQWGNRLRMYKFASQMGKNILVDLTCPIKDVSGKNANEVVAMFVQGSKDFTQFADIVLKDMRELNYPLKKISCQKLKRMDVRGLGVAAEEIGLKDYTDQSEMSNGMFRALSLIIQLEFSLLHGTPSCILIDDIGEGLDFERSVKLLNLIINKAQKSNLQIIMTTNDRFVMNSVPLRYWQVAYRENSSVFFRNINNSSEEFENFSYTGLNNFDFFSADLYKKKIVLK